MDPFSVLLAAGEIGTRQKAPAQAPNRTWARASRARRENNYARRAELKTPTIASSSPDATTMAAPVGKSIL